MKKQILVSCILLIMVLNSVSVYAQSGSYTAADCITLAANQTESTFEITFYNPSTYAGAEVQVLCGEGVEITSVTYNTNVGNAGPTTSNGSVWFSFFTGNNHISDTVTATITISYSGNTNTSILIHKISMYTKDGARVDTELINADKIIEIKKEGANNSVIPPIPPEQEDGTSDGSDYTSPSDSAQNNTNQNNSSQNNSGYNNAGEVNDSPSDGNDSSQSSSSDSESSGVAGENKPNGSTGSKPVEGNDVSNSHTPVQRINIVILIAAIASICINIVLVFLYRKKGK